MSSRVSLQFFAGIAIVSGISLAPSPDITVHEWGTFTTVAGKDGRAVDWLPLGGPDDLPCFVEHADDRAIGRLKGVTVAQLNSIPDYATARGNLIGKVRMETPVLYFYSAASARVNVRVDFPKGLMTEWYPKATVAQQMMTTAALLSTKSTTAIQWNDVFVAPSTTTRFPNGDGPSHYYAARSTDATPLTVGTQSEKFLFYRGVANFNVPLAAVAIPDEGIRVTNLGKAPLPVVVAFTNHDGHFGYHIERNVATSVTIPAPKLDGTTDALRRDLEALLVGEGLFAKEAAAMVDTWRDTWFENGTRVFYVFPRSTVDAVLPLTVSPTPKTTARVFVGRMDVVTSTMQRDVARALRTNDAAAIASYGRLLGPIADRVLAETSDAAARVRIKQILSAVLAEQIRKGTICP